MRVADILYKFPKGYKKSGKWYLTHCPCHFDKRKSLAISDTSFTTNDGKVVETIAIKCFAGCPSQSIRQWLKSGVVQYTNTFKNTEKKPKNKLKLRHIYQYLKDGNLLFEVLRFEPKTFSQRRKDKDGKIVWGLTAGHYYIDNNCWKKCDEDLLDTYEKIKYFPEVEYVLYNIDNVKKGLSKNANARIFIVGGEKDVDRLTANKFLAVTNNGGEGEGKWKSEYTEALHNTNIVFIPDNDLTGYQHLYRVASQLIPYVKSFKVVELPNLKKEHDDVSDWFQLYNGSADWLKKLVDLAADYKSQPEKIEQDFQFKLPNKNKQVQSDFIAALQAEADELSQVKDLSLLGLCDYCKGTGYEIAADTDYLTFAAEQHDNYIVPKPCRCNSFSDSEETNFSF